MIEHDKTIPDFKTFQEAREFWDRHSLADFKDEIEETNEVIFNQKKGMTISLNIGKEDERHLRQIANKRGLNCSDLVTSWVRERLSGI